MTYCTKGALISSELHTWAALKAIVCTLTKKNHKNGHHETVHKKSTANA